MQGRYRVGSVRVCRNAPGCCRHRSGRPVQFPFPTAATSMYVSRAFHYARRFTASLIFFLALALVPVTSVFAAVTTTGEQKTAVILVNFSDKPTTQPITATA